MAGDGAGHDRRVVVWRFLETAPADGAFNMAVDDALLRSVRAGGPPTLRLYAWSPPCLSLGRNQPARGEYDAVRLASAGIDLVRRPTGGRAVLHDDELTYAVAAPVQLFGSPRRAYRRVNEVLAEALRRLGAATTIQGGERSAPALSTTPCFAEPAVGEIVAGGRKVVGSAQVVEGGALLQHGSIPVGRSTALSNAPADLLPLLDGRPMLVGEIVPGASRGSIAAAIRDAWTDLVGPLHTGSLEEEERAIVAHVEGQYRSSEWRCRR